MISSVLGKKTLLVFARLFVLVVLMPNTMAEPLLVGTIKIRTAGFVNNGKAQGSLYEVHNAIFNAAQMDFVNNVIPYKRVALMVEQGELDFTTASHPSKLSQHMLPIVLLFTSDVVIVARKEVQLKSIENLHGKTIAVLRGASLLFFSKHPELKPYEVNDVDQAVKMLSKGRVDAVLTNIGFIDKTLKKMGQSLQQYSQPFHLPLREYWLLYNKKSYDAGKVKKIQAAVRRLQKNGVIREIFTRYNGGKPFVGVGITTVK